MTQIANDMESYILLTDKNKFNSCATSDSILQCVCNLTINDATSFKQKDKENATSVKSRVFMPKHVKRDDNYVHLRLLTNPLTLPNLVIT